MKKLEKKQEKFGEMIVKDDFRYGATGKHHKKYEIHVLPLAASVEHFFEDQNSPPLSLPMRSSSAEKNLESLIASRQSSSPSTY